LIARRGIHRWRLQWRVLTGKSPRSRFLLFGALYFAQGVPWGFFAVALQLRLTKLGLSAGALGEVMTLAWLPWAAKPLLGPIVDRVSFGRWGRRRPFVLLAEAGMAVSLMALAAADPETRLTWFSALIFLHNVFAAAQDVGVDALALDLLTPEERGRANGIMSAAQYGGVVVGGQGLLWVANHLGWPAAFGAAVVLLLVPATLILGVREGPAPAAGQRLPLGTLLWRSFAVRVVILALVCAFIFDLSDGLLRPMMFPLLQRQLGYSEQEVATLSTLAGLMGVVGCLVGGALSDRLGRRWGLLVACLGVALTDFIFVGGRGAWGSYAFILVLGLAGAMASGMVSAASVAMFMDLTDRRLGATQFQVYMSVRTLRTSAATYGGGHLADRTSPSTMFVLGGIVELLPLALLPLLDARRAQAAFAQTDDAAAPVER
jgi:PAT family beta-lactamase induction signal transducer AmpG